MLQFAIVEHWCRMVMRNWFVCAHAAVTFGSESRHSADWNDVLRRIGIALPDGGWSYGIYLWLELPPFDRTLGYGD